jgi:hypothetical protein
MQNDGSPAIPEEQFIDFYVSQTILKEEATLMAVTPEQIEHMQDSLYQVKGVTQSQVEQTLDYYKKDLERWKAFHGKVTQRLEDLHRQAVENKAKRQ